MIISYTRDIQFFSRSMNFHRWKSKYFWVYQLSYVSFCSLLLPHSFMGFCGFKIHWTVLTPKAGSFSEYFCRIKGVRLLLFLHSQYIQLSSVYIILTILCVLWNGKCLLSAQMGIRQNVCFAVSISAGDPNEPWYRYIRVRSWSYHNSHYSPLLCLHNNGQRNYVFWLAICPSLVNTVSQEYLEEAVTILHHVGCTLNRWHFWLHGQRSK